MINIQKAFANSSKKLNYFFLPSILTMLKRKFPKNWIIGGEGWVK